MSNDILRPPDSMAERTHRAEPKHKSVGSVGGHSKIFGHIIGKLFLPALWNYGPDLPLADAVSTVTLYAVHDSILVVRQLQRLQMEGFSAAGVFDIIDVMDQAPTVSDSTVTRNTV
jgi:hypothetical protein